MKTKLIGLLLILCSCNSVVEMRPGIIITEITASNAEKGKCYYGVLNKGGKVSYFFDKCGKFTVGDTIYISKRP